MWHTGCSYSSDERLEAAEAAEAEETKMTMMPTIALGDRATRHIGATTLVLTILAASMALAQPGAGRPVHLEGHWSGTQADKGVIGVITVSADGKEKRSFGVTVLQAFEPEEEGMHVLEASSLQPITMLLRGDEEMIRRFMTASPDEKVVTSGVYRPDSGYFILTSVDVAPRTAKGD